MNKEKFNIIYKHFAKPIYDLAMTYENSVLTIDNKVVDFNVVKCFNELKKALKEQLDKYKKMKVLKFLLLIVGSLLWKVVSIV